MTISRTLLRAAVTLALTCTGARALPTEVDEPLTPAGVPYNPCEHMTEADVFEAQRDHPLPFLLMAISDLYSSTRDLGYVPLLDGHNRPRCLVTALISYDGGLRGTSFKFYLTHASDGKVYLVPIYHFP